MNVVKKGRSFGAGIYDDDATVSEVLRLMSDDDQLSERSAILKVIPPTDNEETVLRRIQRKLKAFREGCPSMVLSKVKPSFEPRRGEFGSLEVPFHIDDDGNEWSVRHAVGPLGPTFLVLMNGKIGGDLQKVKEHPVLKSLRYLGSTYDYDTPEYRYVCSWLGIDPDLDRPEESDFQVLERKKFFDGYFSSNATEEQKSEAISRFVKIIDPLRDDPEAFRESNGVAPSISSYLKMRKSLRVMVDCLPFQYSHGNKIFIDIVDGHIQSRSPVSYPLLLKKPDETDLSGMAAAKVLEQTGMAVVLSNEEFERYRDGGDLVTWFSTMNLDAEEKDRDEARLARSDLQMSRDINEILMVNSYDAHIARHEDRSVDFEKPFSCDLRHPILQSKSVPLKKNNALDIMMRRIRDWRFSVRMRKMKASALKNGRLDTPYGKMAVFSNSKTNTIVIRPWYEPLYNGKEYVYPSFTLKYHHLAKTMFPDFQGYDFSMSSTYGQKPISHEFAIDILNIAVFLFGREF